VLHTWLMLADDGDAALLRACIGGEETSESWSMQRVRGAVSRQLLRE
jgi:hypothetical protein